MKKYFSIPKLEANKLYQPQAEDTSIEADLVQFYLLRQSSIEKRLLAASALIKSARTLSFTSLKKRFSHLSNRDFTKKLAQVWLQCAFIPENDYHQMTEIQDPIQLGTILHQFFQRENIPYFVTGGVAAIAYGEPRTTIDIDIVLSIPLSLINDLTKKLSFLGFYIAGIEDVMEKRSKHLSFIHVQSLTKADLIIADETEYNLTQFQRKQLHTLFNNQEIYLSSPEDIIISKLLWSQTSQSQKQWRDILGILKTQQENIDYEYLYKWGREFRLLEKISQAIISSGVKKLADDQWVKSIIPVALKAFKIVEQKSKIIEHSRGIRIAQGNYYKLIENSLTNIFTIISLSDNQEIAEWNQNNLILKANPSLQDRLRWQETFERINKDYDLKN